MDAIDCLKRNMRALGFYSRIGRTARYQIYDACEHVAVALAAMRKNGAITEDQLATELEKLVDIAVERVKQLSPDYDYGVTNRPFIRNVVLTLFDSCFLSLDAGGDTHA